MAWTHRERVLAALNHEEADRVPIDLGGCFSTGMYFTAYPPLMELLGLEHENATLPKPRRTAVLAESLLQRFDVDTRFVGLGAHEGSRGEIDEDTFLDEWGVTWKKVGDGPYLDENGPFCGSRPTVADLEKYDCPDPGNPGYFRGLGERAAAQRKQGDYAVILNLRYGIVHQGMFLRGFSDWLKDLYKNRAFITRMMEVITDYWVQLADNALDAVGNDVDIVYVGDDLAMQSAPLFDPQIYRQLIKPHHRRMFETVKSRGHRIVYHSCGAVAPLIEDLIDVGVDAINPVQVNASNMDPQGLKEAFGDRISFWGGIDTQRILPFGTPDEVRVEVRRIIGILGANGGYILNSVHNLQPDVPPANIVAMFDEAGAHKY